MGIKGGCESAVHAVREFTTIIGESGKNEQVILKLDVKNAYNSVHRSTVLEEIYKRCPEIYPLVWQSYSTTMPLFIGDTVIESQTGVQQGDPLGPLCFALAIDPIIRPLESDVNLW